METKEKRNIIRWLSGSPMKLQSTNNKKSTAVTECVARYCRYAKD